MILSPDQFGSIFTEFKNSARRIETLPVYRVSDETEKFKSYLDGKPLPSDRNEGWTDLVRSIRTSGRSIERVRVVPSPLTDYFRFEVDWFYVFNQEAGEDTRFILKNDVPDVVFKDTWLFDDSIVVDLSYTPEGEYQYANRNDDVRRLEQARLAWQEFHSRSFDLQELLRRVRGVSVTIS